jgi:hypothetical protein
VVEFLFRRPLGGPQAQQSSRTRAVSEGGAKLDITGDSGETGRTTLPQPYPRTGRAPISTGRQG